jgi:peptide/nickel transport system substrate-binding protein
MVLRIKLLFLTGLLLGVLAVSCTPTSDPALVLPTLELKTSSELERQSPPEPPRALSICLQDEPDSLFIYRDQSESARIVRQAIYDGPVDLIEGQEFPVILSELPSLDNGQVVVQAVELESGSQIVDPDGNLTYLREGVEYFPSGCQSVECGEIYPGQGSVAVDQVQITYHLLPDLTWSDGAALTAADSQISFQIADAIYSDPKPKRIRYTETYQALDDETLTWKGVPGYQGIMHYSDYFFSPLPEHILTDWTPAELLEDPGLNQMPIGWGAYMIEEWIKGDHITLIRNPEYQQADDIERFDSLIFRFYTTADEILDAFRVGECQLAVNSTDLLDRMDDISSLKDEEQVQLIYLRSDVWEQVTFGVDSLNPERGLLSDLAVRKSIAHCINRQAIVSSLNRAGPVVDTYLPNNQLENYSENFSLSYDPEQGIEVLEDAGWLDQDSDLATPRISSGANDFPDGTELQLELILAADGDDIPLSANLIKEDLERCGIGLSVQTISASELLQPGPEGPIFGRNFDLAQFAWKTGSYQPCMLFQSSEIPGNFPDFEKGWGGANAAGFSNPEFDLACSQVRSNLPDDAKALEAQSKLLGIFVDKLPALPLFYRQTVLLADPEIVGLSSGDYPALWNIEEIR